MIAIAVAAILIQTCGGVSVDCDIGTRQGREDYGPQENDDKGGAGGDRGDGGGLHPRHPRDPAVDAGL